MSDAKDRAAQFAELLEQAAAEYRCKPADIAAQLAATRRLSLEKYQAALIDGRPVEVTILKWVLEQEAIHAPPPEIPRVDIAFVESIVSICPNCKHEFPDYTPPPTPAPSATPPPDMSFVNFQRSHLRQQ